MKDGYLITFFTQQSREHNGMPLAHWIVEEAKQLGASGATLSAAKEGFGHDGRLHSEGFFNLEDPPQKIVMALRPEICDLLVARIAEEGVKVFFTKTRVSFGFTIED